MTKSVLCEFLSLILVAVSTVVAQAQISGLPPDCHEQECNKLLGEQDSLRQSQDYRTGEKTSLAAAQLRLKCSEEVRGDQRAFFLDDYAADMESAIGFAGSLRDDRKGCALVREDKYVLKQAIASNKFSAKWTGALTSRIDGAAIYKGMCPFVNGRYAI